MIALLLPWLSSWAAVPFADDFGGNSDIETADDESFRLNVIKVTNTVRLDEIAVEIAWSDICCGDNFIVWAVYEETTPDTWTTLWSLPSGELGTALQLQASPPIGLELSAGKRYAIGFYLDAGNFDFTFEDPYSPVVTAWGSLEGSVFSNNDENETMPMLIDDRAVEPIAHRMRLVGEILDVDGDGSVAGDDCADDDPERYPGAIEYCDGIDNDCDELVDNDVVSIEWHLDADGDGFGDPAFFLESRCDDFVVATGAPNGDDCDDANPDIHPNVDEICDGIDNDCDNDVDEDVPTVDFFADADGDGFGDATQLAITTCFTDPVPGAAPNALDCDDNNDRVFPNAVELCDAVDNNCNDIIDENLDPSALYEDLDFDGWGKIEPIGDCALAPARLVDVPGDCDDTNPNIHPEADELCDAIDNNCDGRTDEDLRTVTFHADNDGDGFGDPAWEVEICPDAATPGLVRNATDCDDADAQRFPGASEICDGKDNDCDDAIVGEDDADADGWFDCEDCAPNDPTIFPGATERCDGFDRNCDGVIPAQSVCDPHANESVESAACAGAPLGSVGGAWLLPLVTLLWRRRTAAQP